ncbi:hypothetical protein C8Q72DRAFT_857176 [Fomitopsis betulina]|nr:hypothetical protein C8Q72DRAFT_857176 [Fomitopsis betulina]
MTVTLPSTLALVTIICFIIRSESSQQGAALMVPRGLYLIPLRLCSTMTRGTMAYWATVLSSQPEGLFHRTYLKLHL